MKGNSFFAGFGSAVGAYLIWGFSAVFFKLLNAVPPFEILMHRMIWSFLLLGVLILIFKRGSSFFKALRSLRTLGILTASTLLVTMNWFLFIWSISNNRILDASLGYYICPLVNVLLGALFLKEKLRPLQWAAVALAAAAVTYLTGFLGHFPWVAMILAFSFGFYGLIRKVAPVEALEGLTIETMLLCIPALVYIYWLDVKGAGTIFRVDMRTDFLLMGTALVTAVPLLLFNLGARRLSLTTIGFLQYIAPTCTFILAVFVYSEPFQAVQGWCFAAIWTALVIYSIDGLKSFQYAKRLTNKI
ncbi:MAG: EamA family transporter RarD [Desulfobacteraceae bacterium]|nr:EamA family transporter RarD [Desulfobacteraceae bacterium]